MPADHPLAARCDYCGLPAVCIGADLAAPRRRCPRCCHRDHRTNTHGPAHYFRGHEAAEGVCLDGGPPGK